MEPIFNIFFVTSLILVLGFVGIFSGFGIATSLVPFFALFIPLTEAILFVGIIHWLNNVWRLILFRKGIVLPLLLQFGVPGVITSFIGAQILLATPAKIVLQIFGVFLVLYALLLIVRPQIKLQKRAGTAIVGGICSGFAAGIFGMGGLVRSIFLTVFDLPKDTYLVTGAAIGFFVDSIRVISYLMGDVRLHGYFAWGLFIIAPLSFIGAWIAKKYVVDYIPQNYFRRLVAVIFLGIGVKLIFFP
jgi:uncharacterized membrane protein YfcA